MNRLPAIATIALLQTQTADRNLLVGFLEQTGYQVRVVLATELSMLVSDIGLIIADEATARSHAAELLAFKQRCLPLYLPILLTLSGQQRATPLLRAGFDDVLRLPLNKDDLLARLEAFLRLHQQSADAQQEGALRYRSTFDLAPVGIAHLDLAGNLLQVNPCMSDLLGRTSAELIGHALADLVEVGDRSLLQAAIETLRATPSILAVPAFEQRYRRQDNSLLWTLVRVAVVRDVAQRAKHLIVIIEDNSLQQKIEQTLRESSHLIRSTIDALSEHICVIDENGKVLVVNKAWRKFGIDNGQTDTMAWEDANYLNVCNAATAGGVEDGMLFGDGIRAVLQGTREEFSMEYPCNSPTEKRWFLARVTRFAEAGPVRVVISHENITATRLAQSHLTYLAHYDNLTGLPNRVLFYERLKQALLQAERSEWTMAVMFIDLDHFKMVNDRLGHAAGDQLLQLASKRIVDCLRGNDTVGRLGGDEFGLFLPDLKTELDAAVIAEKIMHALAEPFYINGAEAFVTSSIGITIYPIDGNDADLLVCSADTAMYRAKQQGRNNYQYFTSHMNAQILQHARLENYLRKALERNELSMHYQPQIDLQTGHIVGVEALMRWQHPELGPISPAVFIPIAEETGLIIPLGEWALSTACAQNKAWQNSGLAPIVMAVNLSARQFKKSGLCETVENILRQTGLAGRYLELELTEGMVMDNTEVLIATMNKLKAQGVRLSIDDFGTGYSNLGYLKRFPLDLIKIDKSFVDSIGGGDDDNIIAATVITLGHSLKLKVIAEGVETELQRAVLQRLGSDLMQGYLFSRPLTADAATALQRQHQPLQ